MSDKSPFYDLVVTINLDYKSGGIDELPSSESAYLKFDASELSAYGWVCQFRKLMRIAGFGEKTIEEYLGSE